MPDPNEPRAPAWISGIQAAGYAALSLISLAVALAVGKYLLSNIAAVAGNGLTDQAYYVLLVILGLSASASLFGAMKSVASVTGTHHGFAISVSGPAAGLFLVVVGGMWLTRPPATFDLIIRLIGPVGADIGDDTWLHVEAGRRDERVPVNSLGSASINGLLQIDAQNGARVLLESKKYTLRSSDSTHNIPANHILRLDVKQMDVEQPPKLLPPPWTQNTLQTDPIQPVDGIDYTCRIKKTLGERAAIEHIKMQIDKAQIPGANATLETDSGAPLLQIVAPGAFLRISVLRGGGADDLVFHFDREGERKATDAVLLGDDTKNLKDRLAALARNAIRDLAVDQSCVNVHR